MQASDLQPLLKPRSIVVIGASNEETRIGGRPVQLAKVHEFQGAVYGINPKYDAVQGIPCFPSVDALPEAPDLAILAIGARDVLPQLEACARKGIKAAVIFAGGFAEIGTPEGAELQESLKRFCESSGMVVCGPNTVGISNVLDNAYGTFLTVMVEPKPKPGEVAVVAQSGGACISIYTASQKRGVGFSYVINTGNEISATTEDYLEFVADDPRVGVVAAYVEGLSNGARFREALSKLSGKRIPTVVYKVGETKAGADAASSHTARLAGDHATFRLAVRDAGAMYAQDIEQLGELTYLARFARKHVGKRVGIVTTSGAFAAILTDHLVNSGLQVPKLTTELQEKLRPHLPSFAIVSNPLDITANVVNSEGGFQDALETMLASEELDCVILFSVNNLIDKLADSIIAAAKASDKLLMVMLAGDAHRVSDLDQAGVPVIMDTARGVKALASLIDWQAREPSSKTTPKDTGSRREKAKEFIASARERGDVTLDEAAGKKLLALYGIETPKEFVVTNSEEAKERFRSLETSAVLKILSPDILHKSEVGGVVLGLKTEDSVADAYSQMMATVSRLEPNARIEGAVLQRQEDKGVEVLVSARKDPTFGIVVSAAMGGTATELMNDISLRFAPVDEEEAREMLQELRLYPLLDGYRNSRKADIGELSRVIRAISDAAVDLSDDVDEIEVNPVIVRPEGAGAIAVDCIVKLTTAKS